MRHYFFVLVSFFLAAHGIAEGNCSERDNEIYGHNEQFISRWRSCGERAVGNGQSTVRCLEKHYREIEQICLQCFGDFTSCGAKECRRECFWDSSSDDCVECGLSKCGAAWEQCTGASVDLISASH